MPEPNAVVMGNGGNDPWLAIHSLTEQLSALARELHLQNANFARIEERLVTLLEDNQRRDSEIRTLKTKVSNLNDTVLINSYAVKLGPKLFFLLFTCISSGGGLVLGTLKLMGKL